MVSLAPIFLLPSTHSLKKRPYPLPWLQLDEPSSASSTPGGATPIEPPAKQQILEQTVVAAVRQCQVNAFHDRSVSISLFICLIHV